jgi:hypothetical protein
LRGAVAGSSKGLLLRIEPGAAHPLARTPRTGFSS